MVTPFARICRRLGARWNRSDEGMTLVEVMTACVVLAIVSVAVFGVLSTTLKTTRTDKARVAAANLASRELEVIRDNFRSSNTAVKNILATAGQPETNPTPIPNSGAAAGDPYVVDGIPFTVVRTVLPQYTGAGVSACDGGSLVLHPSYAVQVLVTWPRMDAVPVRADTMLTPPKGVLSDSSEYGFFAVKVINSAGNGLPDVSVQFAGPSTQPAVTDPSGCAVVQLSSFGTYVATPSAPAGFTYVSDDGNPAPTVSADIEKGDLVTRSVTYDVAASMNVNLAAPSGYALPSTLPMITLGNALLKPSGVRSYSAAGASTTIANLWPSSDGYSLWAGSCADADPATAPANIGRGTPFVLGPGGAASTTITLQALDVTVQDSGGLPYANMQVTATKAAPVPPATIPAAVVCAGGDSTLTLGATDSTGHLLTSLPYGNWVITAGGGTADLASDGATNTVTVTTP